MTNSPRYHETERLRPGQRITYSGFAGAVIRLYDDGPIEAARMYEVRLPGGVACVCGSELLPLGA
jgi:hypothetical protein